MDNDKSQRDDRGAYTSDGKKDKSEGFRSEKRGPRSFGHNDDGDRKSFRDRERRPMPRKFVGRGDRKPRFDGNEGNQEERSSFSHRDRRPRPDGAFSPRNDNRGEGRPSFRQDGQKRDFEQRRPRREGSSYNDRDQRPRQDYQGGERRPRSFDEKSSRFHDGDKRPYSQNRDSRPQGQDRERRPFSRDRDNERRPFRNEGEGGRRPDFKDRDRRPYGQDRERRPFHGEGEGGRRPDFKDRDRRPYGQDRERRPFSHDRDNEKRPFRNEGEGGRRPDFKDRDRRPYGQDRERRPYGQDRERRPYGQDRDRRPSYDRGERRPHDGRDFRNSQEQRRPRPDSYQQEDRRPSYDDRDKSPRQFTPEDTSPVNSHEHTVNAAMPFEEQAAPVDTGSSYASPLMDAAYDDSTNYDASESENFSKAESSAEYDAENQEQPRRDFEDRPRESGPAYFTDMNRPFGRGGRGARGDKRPPLRETVMNMDKDLLKMLARRCNIIGKMKAKSGYLEVREEKEIRASWEKSATQMTRDPRIVHQLFALMQEITFSAKPEEGMAKRTGFNLAPPALPVSIRMHAPLVSRRSRLFLAMAGASGSACRMAPSLLDDSSVECIKMFNQCATSLAWDDDGTLISREGGGLSLPDKVIFVGDDILNFFLLLGHYVSQNTRAKFTGESSLKNADLTAVRSFLPQLGARLSNVMPHGAGFPIRLECSGILPHAVDIPEDLPADCVLGLLLAAPFWENAMSFDLRFHPNADDILEEALAVLTPCKAKIRREEQTLHFTPCTIKTPSTPELGMDLQFAAYILALPLVHGGQVHLDGIWPQCPVAQYIEELFLFLELHIEKSAGGISTSHAEIEIPSKDEQAQNLEMPSEDNSDSEDMPEAFADEASQENAPFATSFDVYAEEENQEEDEIMHPLENMHIPSSALWSDGRFLPLLAACTFIIALRHQGKKRMVLPSEAQGEIMENFFNYLGFEYVEDGFTLDVSRQRRDPHAVWTAPTPAWALAFALAAAAKPHSKLSNPGIMTSLYPQFWNLYNALPSFDIKKNVTEQKNDKPVRRRIIAADQEGTRSGDSPDRDNA